MNADPIVAARHAGEESNDFELSADSERGERQRAVLTAAPAKKNRFSGRHVNARRGCRTSAQNIRQDDLFDAESRAALRVSPPGCPPARIRQELSSGVPVAKSRPARHQSRRQT